MLFGFKKIFFLIPFLFSLTAYGKVLRLAVANTRQPYIMPETESGIEIDILKAVTRRMGYELKLIMSSAADLTAAINNRNVDAIDSLYEIKTVPLYYSDPDIRYQNRIIFLKKRRLSIKKVEDLSKYSIAAFSNAKFSFGDDFKRVAERNKYYTEYKDQSMQAKLLYSERVDVVISDINIFKFQSSKLKNIEKIELDYADIFSPTYYSVAFKDAGLRDEFNKALLSIKKDGSYQKILDHYKESLILN